MRWAINAILLAPCSGAKKATSANRRRQKPNLAFNGAKAEQAAFFARRANGRHG